MVSGKTADFVFKNTTSAGDVAEHVYNNWPEGTTFPVFINLANVLLQLLFGLKLYSIFVNLFLEESFLA